MAFSFDTVSPQAAPTGHGADGKCCWELVLMDMRIRRSDGIKKYGQPVMAGNGRKALVDAYQEVLDQAVYLRQEIRERELMDEAMAEKDRQLREADTRHLEDIAAVSRLTSELFEKDRLLLAMSERCEIQADLLRRAAERGLPWWRRIVCWLTRRG